MSKQWLKGQISRYQRCDQILLGTPNQIAKLKEGTEFYFKLKVLGDFFEEENLPKKGKASEYLFALAKAKVQISVN